MTYLILILVIAALVAMIWFDLGSTRIKAAAAALLAAAAAAREQIVALIAGLFQ